MSVLKAAEGSWLNSITVGPKKGLCHTNHSAFLAMSLLHNGTSKLLETCWSLAFEMVLRFEMWAMRFVNSTGHNLMMVVGIMSPGNDVAVMALINHRTSMCINGSKLSLGTYCLVLFIWSCRYRTVRCHLTVKCSPLVIELCSFLRREVYHVQQPSGRKSFTA